MGLLRFILAVSVVCAHGGGFFGYDIVGGRIAVEAFFVISGYLMQMVLWEKYDGRLLLFWSNRALRIYPTYYGALLLAVLISLTLMPFGHGYFVQADLFNAVKDPLATFAIVGSTLTIVGQEIFLFLQWTGTELIYWPYDAHRSAYNLLILPPAWSISLEIMFYLVAPFLAHRRTAWLVLCLLLSFAGRIALSWMGLTFDPWSHRLFPLELAFFILGMLSYRFRYGSSSLLPRFGDGKRFLILMLLTFGAHPAVVALAVFGLPAGVYIFVYIIALIVTLPTCMRIASASRFDRNLGELSFPIYLVHWSVIEALNVWLGVGGGVIIGTGRTILALVVSVLVSFLLIRVIEAPIERFRAGRIAPPAAASDRAG
jgi:peptidoglycan/LPS O-acetylase OafA/YrhL